MRTLKKIVVVLFILALIALYIIIYAVPGVTDALTKTEILQYGNFKTTDSVTCYFVRNETVYSAIRAGGINYYVADAVKVKKGARILEIVYGAPEDVSEESDYSDIIERLGDDSVMLADLVSEFNGVTSYYIDGYENYFTPETMQSLKYDEVSKLEILPVNVVRDYTRKAEPLYKICDNREWYIVCWIDAGSVSKYSPDKAVTIELPLGQVKATISDIIEDGGKWLIIFRTDRYYEDFARIRSAPATVVTSDYNGIIIRNESITAVDGTIGVYIKAKSGDFVFTPIKVIATDGDNSLVEVSYFYNENNDRVGTVNIYDEILRNP